LKGVGPWPVLNFSEKKVTAQVSSPFVGLVRVERLQHSETVMEWPSLTWKKQIPRGVMSKKKEINHEGTKPRNCLEGTIFVLSFVPLCLRG
jgi:hypothetical protein